MRVLDLGCGRGELARELLPALLPGGTVHGFDLDPAQIAAARRAGTSDGRLRFEVADAEDLYEQPEGRYDLAVCRKLLLHVSRPTTVLQQMARMVRPGGRVAAIEPCSPGGRGQDILARIGETWRGEELLLLLRDAGLHDPREGEPPDAGPPPPWPTTPTDRDQYLGAGGSMERWTAWLDEVAHHPPTTRLRAAIARVS